MRRRPLGPFFRASSCRRVQQREPLTRRELPGAALCQHGGPRGGRRALIAHELLEADANDRGAPEWAAASLLRAAAAFEAAGNVQSAQRLRRLAGG